MRKALKHGFFSALAWTFLLASRSLPSKGSLKLGEALGYLILRFDVKGRRIAYGNLSSSFPSLTPKEIKGMVARCYRNLGMSIAEFSRLPRLSKEEINGMAEVEGIENLEAALRKGRGVILLTAHLGNWELLGAVLAARGYEVNAIVSRLKVKGLDRLVGRIRRSIGVNPLPREALKSAVESLKRNQILAILADIDTRARGAFVKFFGRRAFTPIGPILISLRTGAPIVPAFIVREGEKHRVFILEPLKLEGDPPSDAQRFTELIESFVRRYPDQWIWMHRRWREV